jgi:hypothetical protein
VSLKAAMTPEPDFMYKTKYKIISMRAADSLSGMERLLCSVSPIWYDCLHDSPYAAGRT